MDVLVARRDDADERPGRVPLDDLLSRSDVVSLHCPLTEQTRGLIGARELARMKPEGFLINTARGELVDSAALVNALREHRLAGAGTDVLPEEPPPADHPLLARDIPNLIVTPHSAWTSRESRQRLLEQIAGNIRAWQDGRPRQVVSA